MATSLHFGPEWMRKAPAKQQSASSGTATPGAAPAAARSESPSGRAPAPTALPGVPGGSAAARRNPSLGNLSAMGSLGSVQSPGAVTSPGAFSFAAAAAGGAAAAGASSAASTPGVGASATSPAAAPDDGAGKDAASALSRERLLSLYSSDARTALAAGAGAPKSPLLGAEAGAMPSSVAAPVSKKKSFAGALDRDSARRPTDALVSPGISDQPRGLNARAFSGDKTAGDRPGLFQRGSATGAGITGGAANPLSPTIPRERFAGIQGGVLSGVAPPARKRQDSANGTADALRQPRQNRASDDDARTRQPASIEGHEVSSGSGVAARPEATGVSLSGRFKRDRAPGEGPIGPPTDGSAGFGNFGTNRKRERQIVSSSGARVDGDAAAAGHDDAQASAGGSSGDSLLQHTASVLNALSLDDDPPVGSGSFADDSRDVEAPTSDPAAPPPWSADTAQWYYRDPSGQDQGPFAATIMQDWFQQNYFALDLPMRRAEEESFRPLGEIIASLGHPAQPFLVPPPAPAPAPEPQQAQQQPEHDVFSHGNQPSQQQHQANGLGEHHAGHPYDALGQPAGSDLSRGGWGGAGLPASVQARGWPSLDLGFGAQPGQQMSGFGGPHSPFVQAPQSPFGAAPLFGAGGLRGQDDYLAMVRQRELQEQRQAAAAAAARGHAGPGLGFATPYGGDFGGHAAGNGWEASAPGGWNAATAHLHHQQPDVFGTPQHQHQQQHQQQGQAASGSPWGTPARQFGTAPQQPQYHFQQPQQVPWSDSSAHQQAEAQLHKSDPEPIGTPRRSRTPVEEASSQQQDFAEQQQQQQEEAFAQQQRDAQQQEEEEAQRREEQERQERETAVMLQQQEAAHAEPEPEEVWPQSPTAVEFAAEPPLPAHHEQQNNLMDDGPATSSRKRSRRKGQQTRAEEAAGAPMPTADLSSYAGADVGKRQAPPSAAGGNVKVVSQEQFKRPGGAEEDSKNQAPLSAWLPDSGSNTPTTSKAPWAAATESSASAPGLTLREIQEAEARQAESRRAAERALAAQRARSMASGDDTLPATMTWGLATGHASQGSSAPEPAADAAASASPAPWSAARPTAKKTLTEIQEEERKRAQKARDAQAAQQAALRRGYADSAGKTQVPPPAAAASGAWSVVGSKPASAVPASARPPATPVGQRAGSLGATPPVGVWATAGAKQNGTPAAKVQSPVIKTKMVVAPSASSEQLGSGQPSADFLRYCKEQLKGLNVKADDFIEMLLSFPLDPSPDVVEIIAESVYANSSTLDGRRFAADFVAKRKLDQSGRGAGSSAAARSAIGAGLPNGAALGAGRSASDVLKSSTKPAAGAADFGGFKVVKAKGGKKTTRG